MAVNFTTPVGRLVQGHPFEAQDKDQQGNPRVIKSGPNAGQPAIQYFVAVAFAKNDPQWPAFFALLQQEAKAGFPNLFNAQGQCVLPTFAWKVIDGDGVDTMGRPNSGKEGFAGHWVVRFTSGFPPKCFHVNRYQPHEQIQNAVEIKRGYYVRISGTIQGNGNAQKPGLYLNAGLLEVSGFGPEIITGPSATDAFGGNAPVLPPGASATPIAAPAPGAGGPAMAGAPAPTAGAPGMAPGAPAPTAGAPAPAAMTAPAPTAATAAPAASPAPYAGFMQAPGAPTPQATAAPAPAPAPAAPQLVLTAACGGATLAQMYAQGWTDDLMVAQGYAVRA